MAGFVVTERLFFLFSFCASGENSVRKSATNHARKPLFAILKEKLRWKLRLQKIAFRNWKIGENNSRKVLVEKPKLNFSVSHSRFSK